VIAAIVVKFCLVRFEFKDHYTFKPANCLVEGDAHAPRTVAEARIHKRQKKGRLNVEPAFFSYFELFIAG